MKTALITGASSGIGLELSKILASEGYNLVIVARRKDKLDNLKSELEHTYPIQVEVLAKDLSEENSAQTVFDFTQNKGIQIEILINNAGFGDYGFFSETEWQKEAQMLQLNIVTLTQLCKLFSQDMRKNKSGKILNVASTAAFQPGPMMSVYFASKAYVLHFSEALANELKSANIGVTALCPGLTESEFVQEAGMGKSQLSKGKMATTKQVADYAIQAMMNKKPVAIHGFKNRMMVLLLRFTPRSVATKVTRYLLS
mgnify:CR=1 FL=1